ncbi:MULTISPECIES: hypothetical protein [Vibrio]|nr:MULTISPECIES: hypothetical protein [Vibrio]
MMSSRSYYVHHMQGSLLAHSQYDAHFVVLYILPYSKSPNYHNI